MDAATLEALKKSIEHWEENVRVKKPEDVKLGLTRCALCHLFWHKFCKGCPVDTNTGSGCSGTPYVDTTLALDTWRNRATIENELAFQTAAQAELDFLKSLLPEEKVDG